MCTKHLMLVAVSSLLSDLCHSDCENASTSRSRRRWRHLRGNFLTAFLMPRKLLGNKNREIDRQHKPVPATLTYDQAHATQRGVPMQIFVGGEILAAAVIRLKLCADNFVLRVL